MKRILFIGHFAGESYGDEIALYLFRDYINTHFSDSIQFNFRDATGDDLRTGFHKKYSTLDYDFIILGGGTSLSNFFREFADETMYALSLSNKPYAIFGSGVYFDTNFNDASCNQKTARYINNAKFIAVRDTASKDYLLSISSDKEIRVLYDPGLVTRYAKQNITFNKPVIGINVAQDNMGCLGTVRAVTSVIINKVVDFITQYSDRYSFMFVPFNKDDEKFFGIMQKVGVVCCKYGPPDYISGITQNADFFVGERVHADITCAAYGIPFVSITYTYPNLNFLTHIGYQYYVMSSDLSYTNATLAPVFESVVANKDAIRNYLVGVASVARASFNSNAETLCNIILSN